MLQAASVWVWRRTRCPASPAAPGEGASGPGRLVRRDGQARPSAAQSRGGGGGGRRRRARNVVLVVCAGRLGRVERLQDCSRRKRRYDARPADGSPASGLAWAWAWACGRVPVVARQMLRTVLTSAPTSLPTARRGRPFVVLLRPQDMRRITTVMDAQQRRPVAQRRHSLSVCA